MTKNDFILTMLSHHMSPFTNRIALKQNIADVITLAEEIYDEASAQLKAKEPALDSRPAKRQGR